MAKDLLSATTASRTARFLSRYAFALTPGRLVRPPVTRLMVEWREGLLLSPFACRSEATRGRLVEEPACDIRTCYARDIDRIIYSQDFRKYQGKTQVIPPEVLATPLKYVIHTRLFHVVEVARIARTICRALGLNEDLAEAIALGHDLGHTPFGHEGETVLSILSQRDLGVPFKHNRQSLRVVDELEKLNLTFEVRDGILRHDGEKKDPVLRPFHQSLGDLTLSDNEFPTTLEGCVVRLADRIAYLPKDLEDAILLGVVRPEQVPELVKTRLGLAARDIIDTLVKDIIAVSANRPYITMSDGAREALDQLFGFNYQHYYLGEYKRPLVQRIEQCITVLYDHYTKTVGQTPQTAIDTIAGMTDAQALATFREISLPRA